MRSINIEEIIEKAKSVDDQDIKWVDDWDFLHSDQNISVGLAIEGHIVGISGISYGLEEYYEHLDFATDFPDYSISHLINHTKGKWGLTQMQLKSGVRDLTYGKAPQKRTIRMWQKVMNMFGEHLDFILPANKNFYWHPINFEVCCLMYKSPSLDTLKRNYDFPARQTGFYFDEESGIYLRKAG